MSSLSHLFKARLCNFKATGINNAPRAAPPFCVRGNFDGRAFNSEYFHGATMSPMWALDLAFDYHTSTIESMATKYLVVECFGGDIFLGMARIDLMTLATGPKAVSLSLREGSRINGTVSFEVSFELISNVTVQLSRVSLSHIAPRGYENNPSPYLNYGFADTGANLESPIAANAQSPEWERLPALHLRNTYQVLCDQRIKFELKHSRNGFTAGISDPLMATFEVPLDSVPIEIGKDTAVPFRQMVHSLPNYPFPFSTELHGIIEFRNVQRVVQMKTGLLTDDGVVGGVAPAEGVARAPSPQRVLPEASRLQSPQRVAASPYRSGNASAMNVSVPAAEIVRPPPVALSSANASYHLPPPPAAPPVAATPAPTMSFASAVPPAPAPAPANSADLRLLDDVAYQQQTLLSQVQTRLQEVNRRRNEIAQLIASHKAREEAEVEAASQRRAQIDGDMAAVLAERERLELTLKDVQVRREEENRLAAQQAADRERTKRALEAEQQEVAQLQARTVQLRTEMNEHLQEEERRYQLRVREAEDARRRAQQDAEMLASLENRLANAEARAATRRASPRRTF